VSKLPTGIHVQDNQMSQSMFPTSPVPSLSSLELVYFMIGWRNVFSLIVKTRQL